MTYQTPEEFIKNVGQVAFTLETRGTCRKNKKTYLKDFCTFDIETNTIELPNGEHEAFMYVWQFYIADTLVIGRHWEQWQAVVEALEKALGLNEFFRLVCYSHNLSYEFQFERNFFPVSEVFATSKREVVRALFSNGFEARCSYRLTNMSLAKFLESQPNVIHKKLDGAEFNYKEVRYPETQLTKRQLEYCANDVVGLYEGLCSLFDSEEDDIATTPYTSTGYVRREFRKRMNTNKYNRDIFLQTALTPKQYILMKTATRGGNCHANPVYSNRVLHHISSMDMTSAYPAVMLQCKFPMSRFVPIDNKRAFKKWIQQGYACLLEITFHNIRTNTVRTIPYISKSKCVELVNPTIDNGRVLSADKCTLVITDIDYNIIERTYNWIETDVNECYISYYGYLPKELRQQVYTQFVTKCTLKHGDPYYYAKSKNKLNSDFGMMLTDICRSEVEYEPLIDGENPFTEVRPNIDEALEKYYTSRTSFLAYQWGTWVTCHCRARLQKAIDGLGSDIVYCDTDSAKYFDSDGKHTKLFEELNAEIRVQANEADVPSIVEYNGEVFELGIWEEDGDYAEFKTLGAKKYCYSHEVGGDIEITVAGLGKKAGAQWLNEHGGIKAFCVGTVIPEGHSGRTVAKYNDLTKPVEKSYNGHRLKTGSNTALYDTSYTFSITDDYEDLLEHIDLLY